MSELITGTIWEDSGAFLMARIVGNDAANIQQADVSTIAYSVYDLSDTSSPATGTLTVANVVFDALQTDARWTEDTTGYNFGWASPASLYAVGDKTYRVELLFTPASGEAWHVVYDVVAKAILRT